MVMLFNGIPSAQVAISGAVTMTATPRTLLTFSGSKGAGTNVLGTCGAGKRWVVVGYVTNVYVSADTTITASININGSKVIYYAEIDSPAENLITHANHSVILPYEMGFIVNAGETLNAVVSTYGRLSLVVMYIEETI